MLLKLAFRNAWRNVSRTLFTASTVVLGTALLTVALAWMDGVFGQVARTSARFGGEVRVVTPVWAEKEALMPLADAIEDSGPLIDAVQALGARAYPRVLLPVTLGAGDELGEVFGLAIGAPLAWFEDELELSQYVVAGEGELGEGDKSALLGRTLAERIGVGPGDELMLLGQTRDGAMSPMRLEVRGVLSGGNQLVDQGVFFGLADARWMADLEDGAAEVLIYGGGPDAAGALAARVATLPEVVGLEVQAWDAREPMKGLLSISAVVQGVISGFVVFLCALAVWNTMTMSVLERTGEIGVLRAMGLGRAGVVLLFVAEGVGIAVLGGLVGVALGSSGALYLQIVGVELGDKVSQNTPLPLSTTMHAELSVGLVVASFLLGVAMALVGTAAPALRAAYIQPVDAMRR